MKFFHLCPKCGNEWSHTHLPNTTGEYWAIHTCKNCGTIQTEVHRKEEK